MAQPILLDDRPTVSNLALKSGTPTSAAPSIFHALGKQAAALSDQETELQELLSSGSLPPDELQKLLSEISSDTAAQLQTLLDFMSKLPKDEQDKAIALLTAGLPSDEQAQFPSSGTLQEQFAFLEKYMASLSLADRQKFVLSMVQTPTSDDSDPTGDIIHDINYLLDHLSTISEADLEKLLQKILVEIGVFLAQVQEASTQTSNDQVLIAKLMAEATQKSTEAYEQKLEAQKKAQEERENSFWGKVAKVFGNKVFQIILTAIIGLLFCETPLGFIMLAGMIALQASGVLDKATDALAKAMGGGPVAQFFASLIITLAVTGVSGLGEVAGQAAIRTAAGVGTKVAVEEGAAAGTKVAANTVKQEAEKEALEALSKAGEQAGEKVGESGTQDATQASTKTADDAAGKTAEKESGSWMTKSGRFFSGTTAMNFLNVLVSSNLFYNLAIACGASKDKAMIIAAILNLVAMIATMGGSLIASAKSGATTLLDLASQGSKFVKYGTLGLTGTAQAGESGFNIDAGVNGMNYADQLKNELAPLAGQAVQAQSIAQLFTTMVNTSNTLFKNIIENQSSIFSVNFAIAWQTAAQGLEISA